MRHFYPFILFFLLFSANHLFAQCPSAGDLVITEIMPNPDAVSDSNGEYFELYNATNAPIDIMDLEIKDVSSGNSHTVATSVVIAANGYAVLAKSDDTPTNGGLTVDYVVGSTLSLGNTSMDGVIIECEGTIIDQVAYTSSFPYSSGVSMELDPTTLNAMSNDDVNNWQAATETYGDGDNGTPGAANTGTVNCSITAVAVSNDMCSGNDFTFEVSFTVVGGSGDYEVIDATNGNTVLASGTTSPISVTISNNNSTTAFDVNVRDEATTTCMGTAVTVNPQSCFTCPAAGDLVITEFLANPTVSESDGEYIEIYNASANPIDLNGFVIKDDGVNNHIIGSSLVVAAGGYVVLGRNATIADNGGVTVDYVYSGITLSNSSDDEIIIVCGATEIDRVNYDSNFPISEGESTSLSPDNLNATDNNSGTNWCESTTEITTGGDLGTPGSANDVCPEAMCSITSVQATNTRCDGTSFLVDVYFSVTTGGGSYEVIDVTNGDAILATGATSPITVTIMNNTSTTPFDLTVRDVATPTCIGNNQSVTPLDCSIMITCPNAGELVITEIMYNPTAVSDANGEYFEIHNITNAAIDLLQFLIQDDVTDSHTIPTSVTVPANGYVVLGKNDDMMANGGVAVDYVYGSYNLTNSGDQIVLICGGAEIDRVNYDDGGDFPASSMGSIQLNPDNLNATENDMGANWCESTAEITTGGDLGTPGAANSVCSSLAVELLQFTAKPSNNAIQLNWQTASEIDHDRFIVERSVDGVDFIKIGEEAGQNLVD
ncbi:MAG: lamin tail domain-containing protein, partial [Saprospiraceae bacterium]